MVATDLTIPCQRALFDIPSDVAWLNCAYMAPLMTSVSQAGVAGVLRKTTPWAVKPAHFFGESETARGLFASLIGGDADGVAFVPSVSYAMAVAAANFPLDRRQTVVTVEGDFPSAVYAFRELAAGCGARVVTVPRPDDFDWTSALLAAITPETAIVVAPPCTWTDGGRIDLEKVAKAARAVSAALVVDATQALGAVPFSVAAVQPDLVVASAYKWLLGPYSIGMMWLAPKWRGGRPVEHNWLNRAGSEDFARLVDYRDDYQPGARRFDVGERSNFALMPMVVAALEQILAWRPERIAATIGMHTTSIAAAAAELGFVVAPPEFRSPHMIGLWQRGGVPGELATRLADAKVFVSVRGDAIRVSPHVWTSEEDVGRLLALLAG
jgi:selenocysteine lyase/cysteine desulfurase